MPPPRIAALAREPRLTVINGGKAKDAGGYGTGYAGFGFGAWGFLPGFSGQAVTPYCHTPRCKSPPPGPVSRAWTRTWRNCRGSSAVAFRMAATGLFVTIC